MRPVSDEAWEAADAAARRVKRRLTPVRVRFVRRADPFQSPPPLARMLRGGRGGEVRLKSYLALLWLAGGGREHTVRFTARTYASLLGLHNPAVSGARRVNDALCWLEREQFITVARRPGHEPLITLLSDAGTGTPYVPPGAAEKDWASGKAEPDNVYVKLPPTFWTGGWAAALPGPALAMLLVTLDLRQRRSWVSPREFALRYDLSEDTRSRGFAALRAAGLVDVGKQPVSRDRDGFEWRRVRNTYTFQPSVLDMGLYRPQPHD